VSGRAEPDIVAPQSATSYATPTVSSAAALLVQYAHNTPAISNASFTSSRTGLTLEYAETNDAIKASLMAGAVRRDPDKTASQQISDYTAGFGGVQNGLDSRYGAGQLNIDNSYHILAGKQRRPARSVPSASTTTHGRLQSHRRLHLHRPHGRRHQPRLERPVDDNSTPRSPITR